ncbi:MAG: response regulator [Chloroflexi bacterium]|nr:MAG: response regulator [Chloroflexota bacterium]
MNARTGQPKTCLIAESDLFIAKLLVRYAEASGLVCIQAKEGDAILPLARELKPDVIIQDVEFPGEMLGWETLRALKASEETRHIRLISCSWMIEPEVRSLVGELDGYLQKPDITYTDFEKIMRMAGIIE